MKRSMALRIAALMAWTLMSCVGVASSQTAEPEGAPEQPLRWASAAPEP